MLRVQAGPCRCDATDGRYLMCDQQLTREQTDVLYRLLDHHKRHPDDVSAIEVNEGGVTFEPVAVVDWDTGTDEPAGSDG